MNCKTIARSISFVLLSGFLALNLIIMSSQPARASEDEGGNCKWQGQTCPDNTYREICVVDGDGNSCKCGAVTRSCN